MTPHVAYYKCNGKINKKLEQYIIKDPCYAYRYAKDVIKGRWKEAENIIATNSECAYAYALNIIKGKLPKNMHNAMIIHGLKEDRWVKYYLDFIKDKTQPYSL